MKKIRTVAIVIILVAQLFMAVQPAGAMPPLPYSCYGTVKVNSVNVPVGTVVTAWINGVRYAYSTVMTYGADTVYSLDVPGDDSSTPEIEGGVAGNTIEFYIGPIKAAQTRAWSSGSNSMLNLTGSGSDNPPTNLSLSGSSVVENLPAGTSVGTLSTTDADTHEMFAYTLVAGSGSADNASFGISGNSLVTAAPFDFEIRSSYSVRVRTTDSFGQGFERSFSISVTDANDPPVIAEGLSVDISMSMNGSPIPFSLSLHASDQDAGDTLTWSIGSPASHGTASASGTGAVKSIGYTPAADYAGQDSFVVQVQDPHEASASITVHVTITGVNTPPTITESDPVSVEMYVNGQVKGFSLTLHATDADAGNTLTWSIDPAHPASHGAASASGTGTSSAIGYTPALDYHGADSFVVLVSDGQGGTDSITVNVTVKCMVLIPLLKR